jgi:hypothetical protein
MSSLASAQTLSVKSEPDAKYQPITVTVPGKFETVFNLRKGFGAKWFDLAHDPERKRDLAPVADENGFFWVKMSKDPNVGGGSWYANPAQKTELVESGPVRIRVRLSGWHMRYGSTERKSAIEDVPFELTWTVYPTGAVYASYAIDVKEDVPLHHFLAIIKTNGAWGKNGKGEGKDEVHPASEAGNDVKPDGAKPASWVLQWSNGPTFFEDFLMVFYKGKFGGTYWNEGYQDQDYRTGLDILKMFPGKRLHAGKTTIDFMFRVADDMNGADAAAPYANDYRAPDALAVTKGELDKSDPGDDDKDGFNEAEGGYVLKAAAGGVAFTLHGAKVPRMAAAFKVKGWTGDAPKTIKLAGKDLAAEKDFNASAKDGVLLFQFLIPVKEDAEVVIAK